MTGRLRITGFAFWTLFFLVLAGFITAAWWVFLSDTFRVKEIEVRGNAFLTDMEVRDMLDGFLLEGRHVWFTNFPEMAGKIEGDPRIAAASFDKRFPDYVCLTLQEATEFATVLLRDGSRYTVGSDGRAIRMIEDGQPDIGPLLCGFSERVLREELPGGVDLRIEKTAWTGFSSDPFLAGKPKQGSTLGERELLREKLRYQRAIHLAEETWIDRNEETSGYEYIGLDANYDLYLQYPGRPPVVVGGFMEPYDMVVDLRVILDYDDPGLWGKYDYVDLHLPGYARGVTLDEIPNGPLKKWSGPGEAARVAAWKIWGEVDYRLKK